LEYNITHSPAFSKLDITLSKDESLLAQPGSMLSMTTGIRIASRVGGQLKQSGVAGGIKSLLSGEGFFTTVFTSVRDGEQLTLAPDAIGEVLALEIAPASTEHGTGGIFISKGSYLASVPELSLEASLLGLKGLLTKKGFFVLHATGSGTVFLSSFGAIIERELKQDEQLVVDNSYVIAFSDTIKYELVTASRGLKDSIFSGEGLVNRYTGPGKIFYQTRAKPKGAGLITTILNSAT
jgi:uncharacterized protein (TIGR00266 family)